MSLIVRCMPEFIVEQARETDSAFEVEIFTEHSLITEDFESD
jgi:hypothetical protein